MVLDYGTVTFTATLLPDMRFSYVNNEKGKSVKNPPKSGKTYDQDKLAAAQKQLESVKEQVKLMSAARIKQIYAMLQTGETLSMEVWKKRYLSNIVMRTLACSLLWGVYSDTDELLMPFRFTREGAFVDENDQSLELADSTLVSVVDGAQLSEEALEGWRKVFYAMGTRPVIRQFETPGRFVTPAYIQPRYENLTVSSNMMYHRFSTKRWGDESGWELVEGNLLSIEMGRTDGFGDVMAMIACSVCTGLPDFAKMTCRQKRLWNRDIIYMDALLHPERKVKTIVESGDTAQIQSMVDTRLITPDNVIELLNLAIEKERTEATALLLELRHQWLGDLMDPFQDLSLD